MDAPPSPAWASRSVAPCAHCQSGAVMPRGKTRGRWSLSTHLSPNTWCRARRCEAEEQRCKNESLRRDEPRALRREATAARDHFSCSALFVGTAHTTAAAVSASSLIKIISMLAIWIIFTRETPSVMDRCGLGNCSCVRIINVCVRIYKLRLSHDGNYFLMQQTMMSSL